MSDIGRLEAKLLGMTIIFLTMFICGLLPIWVANWVKEKGALGVYVISTLRCFGGGVFLGAYLLHSAPDVRLLLEEYWLIPSGIEFPMSELITGGGFFFIMFLEQLIGFIRQRSEKRVEPVRPAIIITNGTSEVKDPIALTNVAYFSDEKDGAKTDETKKAPEHVVEFAIDDKKAEDDKPELGKTNHYALVAQQSRLRSVSDVSDRQPARTNTFGHGHSHLAGLGLTPKPADDDVLSVASSRKTDHLNNSQGVVRSIVFIVAMSFDCIFEGMAMGLKTTTLAVFNLFIAIVSHEFIMSFCLGLELTQYYKSAIVALGAFLYALTIPIGVSIGIVIFETQENPSNSIYIVNGVLQCLSAGTFIYVSCLGILSYEMGDKTSFGRMLAVIIGFLFMAGMACISPEESTEAMTTFYPYENSTNSAMWFDLAMKG